MRRLQFASMLLFTLCLATATTPAARADAVLDWNTKLLEVLHPDNAFLADASGKPLQWDAPAVASRKMAIVNAAIFNAVNTIDRRYAFYHYTPDASLPVTNASTDAAVSMAARVTMTALFPKSAAAVTSYFNTKEDELLTKGTPQDQIDRGYAVGRAAADAVLKLRTDDGCDPYKPCADDESYGKYRTSHWEGTQVSVPASAPQWGSVAPFVMTTSSQFRAPPPPGCGSQEYATAVNQTRQLGAKTSTTQTTLQRTVEQTQIAYFWADKGLNARGVKIATGTVTPPGHWLTIAMTLVQQPGRQQSLLDNARLMALLSLSQADAAIACWDIKYTYREWRPIHAIHLAETDPASPNFVASLKPDTAWMPLIPTSNHPEYPSGHSTFSGAAAQLLSRYFKIDPDDPNAECPFVSHGDDAMYVDKDGAVVDPGTPGATAYTRSFRNFWQAAHEAGMSRIYGGIHYQFSNTTGLDVGKHIGDWVFDHALPLAS